MSIAMEHEDEVIGAIEYRRLSDGRVVPWSVFCAQKGTTAPGRASQMYDVVYSRRDDDCYYEMTGFGGQFYLNGLSEPDLANPQAVWWDRNVFTPVAATAGEAILSDAQIVAMGYAILTEPLPFLVGSEEPDPHPLERFSNKGTVFCIICEDFLPDDDLCPHLFWCPTHGWWAGPGTDVGCNCSEESNEN